MLDDLFKESKHGHHSGHFGHNHHPTGYGHENDDHYNLLMDLVQKLLRNKAILAGIVIAMLVVVALGIWLIVTILPYLGQVISMLEKQGLKGLIETVAPYAQKIWEGAGK